MADSCCIAELKETIEEMNAELIQSHTKISKFNAKVREQAEAAQKEIRELQEENARLARDLKESREKCRIVKKKWKLAEQKLALFSQKPDVTTKESLAQNKENNDDALNINSLPNKIILEVFGYLTQNQLGQIARVCKRWNKLTKSPDLWKKVNVKFYSSCKSQTSAVKSFINRLPSFVTSIRINFKKKGFGVVTLDFGGLCVKLQEKCVNPEELILTDFALGDCLPTVIVLCSEFLQNLKNLVLNHCKFTCRLPRKFCGTSKIEVLDLSLCVFESCYGPEFSRMPDLKVLCLYGSDVDTAWFPDDTSFFNQLHVLNVGCRFITPIFFAKIQNHALNLKELYLCDVKLRDCDLTFNDSAFPRLQSICLSDSHVTREGIVSLIQSCPSLENVYVDKDVAESVAVPFVVANRYKSGIVKAIGSNDEGHNHNIDNLTDSLQFSLTYILIDELFCDIEFS